MYDDTLIEDLKEIGFTEYQSKAYLAAVSSGTSSLSTLAKEADIPQQRIYDVVDSLEAMGLLEVHEGRQGKEAFAPPPETVLEELKRQRIDRYSRQFDYISERVSNLHDRIESPPGFITVVKNRSSLLRHLGNAIDGAEWWLYLGITPALYEEVRDEITAATDRGVTVRLIIQGEADDPRSDLTFDSRVQVRSRLADHLLVAADRSYALYQGLSSSTEQSPVLVACEATLVTMFQRYTEQIWGPAHPIQMAEGFPRRYLNPLQVILDIGECLGEESLEVTIEGHETESEQSGLWTGRIVDHELVSNSTIPYAIPEKVSLVVETEEGTITVGGWDATIEDVAAHGIEIDRP